MLLLLSLLLWLKILFRRSEPTGSTELRLAATISTGAPHPVLQTLQSLMTLPKHPRVLHAHGAFFLETEFGVRDLWSHL
jgi:hypothetical protein